MLALTQRHVLLEIYLWHSGRLSGVFVDALCDAADRGGTVSVLLDDFGCRGFAEPDREWLAAHGVRLALHNPLTLRRVTSG